MKLIIDDASTRPLRHRLVSSCGTVLCWAAWGYLWRPLISCMAAVLGLSQMDGEYRVMEDVSELGRLMTVYLIVIVTLGAALLSWARVDYLRFRKRRRYGDRRPMAHAEIAEIVKLPAVLLTTWMSQRHLSVHHSSDGQVKHVDVLDASADLRKSA